MSNFSRIALAAVIATSFALPVLAQPSTTAANSATSGVTSAPADKTLAGKAVVKKPAVNTGLHRAAATDTKPATTKPTDAAKPAAAAATDAKPAVKPTDAKPATAATTDVKKPNVAAAPVAPVTNSVTNSATTSSTGASATSNTTTGTTGTIGAIAPKPAN